MPFPPLNTSAEGIIFPLTKGQKIFVLNFHEHHISFDLAQLTSDFISERSRYGGIAVCHEGEIFEFLKKDDQMFVVVTDLWNINLYLILTNVPKEDWNWMTMNLLFQGSKESKGSEISV